MLRLDSGDISGAWADLMAIRHLARRIGSGYTLVENLAGIGFEAIGCFGCREVATSRELTGTQARTFLADLQRIGPMPDLVSILDEGERFFILDSIMVLARATNRRGLRGFKDALKNMDISAEKRLAALPDTLPYMRSLEWDEVLKIVNPPYDSFIAAARRKTFKAQTEALAAYDRRVEGFAAKVNKLRSLRLTRRTVSRMIGCVLASQSMPGRAVILRDRGTVEGELSVVAMALAAYRAEKKAYPDKLSGLSPGYLKKVPDDLFVDKPFGYKRTGKGYLLYSVGENMKYDGEKKEDDIVVEVK
jgi:hypothetical protein